MWKTNPDGLVLLRHLALSLQELSVRDPRFATDTQRLHFDRLGAIRLAQRRRSSKCQGERAIEVTKTAVTTTSYPSASRTWSAATYAMRTFFAWPLATLTGQGP